MVSRSQLKIVKVKRSEGENEVTGEDSSNWTPSANELAL